MKRSTERILTTHTGSLPRPENLVQLMVAKEQGKQVDARELADSVRIAVAEVVKHQVAVGIDIISDGEMSKIGFANLKSALQGVQTEEVFMPAASPGTIAQVMQNNYYPTQEAYLYALADEMRYEYQAIVAAGFLLQLDCPDLAMQRHTRYAGASIEEFRRQAQQNIEALNYALTGISPEQVRVHVCWGNYPGPHHRDVPLKDIIDLLFMIQGNALSIEAANPRHEHEWNVFQEVHLPEGIILIPGLIDTCSTYIEHPKVVAQRLVRFAQVVGRENVIAGTDCGFGTFVGAGAVAPSVAWDKLQSLAEGARLASQELW